MSSIVLTIVLLVLVEIVAGFFVPPLVAREIPGDAVSRTVTYIQVNPAPLERDVDLLWRNVPNARKTQLVNPQAFGRADEWTIENNSLGLRGPELSPRNPDVFRIVCVGDSITFGFSVDQPDTYPRQLLDVLAKRHPDKQFEVINAGVPGWSWLQGLRYLDLRGMSLEPDLVLIGHGTNDQLFPAKFTDEERFLRLSSPMAKARQKIAAFAAETNLFRAISRALPERPTEELSPGCREQIAKTGGCRRVSVDQIASAVHEVFALVTGKGAALIVVNTDFVHSAAVKGARSAADNEGIPFVDLVAEIDARKAADEKARASRLGLAPVSVANSQGAAEPKKRVALRAVVPDARAVYRAEGFGYFRPEFTFHQPLLDDGTGGDERAGDGVFSTMVEVPAEIAALEYKYYQGDKAEFVAIPPLASTLGDRVLQVPASGVGPVDVFGEALFMVERAHPNRDGHRVIAEMVADKIETLPRFRDFAKGKDAS